ncbi:hypothetical protein ACFTUC_41595 [Streptomyces sp. NPDC056944]|uniref:hypothetical protein n=1 Tax=Streptomyces sp. NPDC056944 TaxID=3345972 RepID=UPI003644305E
MSVHTDSVTGQPIEGKAIILQTTEGHDIVSPDTLYSVFDLSAAVEGLMADALGVLTARVEELEEQLRELKSAAPTAAEEEPAAAGTTARKAAAK